MSGGVGGEEPRGSPLSRLRTAPSIEPSSVADSSTKALESPAEIPAVTTFRGFQETSRRGYELSGISAFALVTLLWWREMVMPIGRYIAWVGTSLLALLFVADWFLPKSLPEPAAEAINKPVIRIASIQQPPERIVIDTSQPTIVPPPTLVGDAVPGEPSSLQSYASVAPPPPVIDADKNRQKVVKRQGPKVAAKQPPMGSTPLAPSRSSATAVTLTRLSFADIISGRLARNLFNLR